MIVIEYFKSVGFVLLLEIITVAIGLYYLITRNISRTIKLYIYYIMLTLAVEVLALYTAVGYFSDYKYFGIVKDTPFVSNFWLYNILEVVSIGFLLYYFGRLLTTKKSVQVLLALGTTFVISCILVFILIEDLFFSQLSLYVTITGALLLLISISFYLLELLKGKIELKGQNKFPLFVVVGVGISYLASLPFLIYSHNYFYSSDKEFIDMYIKALQIINIFVYLIIIKGFFICLSKKKT